MLEAYTMDCHELEFSPQKSEARIQRALRVFPSAILYRILALALYLLGAKRKAVATLVGVPEESLKTALRVVLQDGFQALQDRRRADAAMVVTTPIPSISAHRDHQQQVMKVIVNGGELTIPSMSANDRWHLFCFREKQR